MKVALHSVLRASLLLLAGIVFAWLASISPVLSQSPMEVPGQFIVTWVEGVPVADREGAVGAAGGSVVKSLGSDLVWLLQFPDTSTAVAFRTHPYVLSLDLNYAQPATSPISLSATGVLTANEPLMEPNGPPICLDCGGGGPPPPQIVPHGLYRIGAQPGNVPYTGAGIGVAIIDSGINALHRDLIRPNGTRVVKAAPDCHKEPSINSCDIDVVYGGHGTWAAGVIAAVNNDVDLVGVAPDATLYNVNIYKYDSGCGTGVWCSTTDTLISGLNWVQTNHALVSPPIKVVYIGVNYPVSCAGQQALKATLEELRFLGISVVVAAGDDPTREVSDQTPSGCPWVVAVAATTTVDGMKDNSSACASVSSTPADTAASWTSDGALDANDIGVSISAPGELKENGQAQGGVCALVSVGLFVLNNGDVEEPLVTSGFGTNISAAHVAGVIALMKEQEVDLGFSRSARETQDRIRATASRAGVAPLDSRSPLYSFDGQREGIVSAPAALE